MTVPPRIPRAMELNPVRSGLIAAGELGALGFANNRRPKVPQLADDRRGLRLRAVVEHPVGFRLARGLDTF